MNILIYIAVTIIVSVAIILLIVVGQITLNEAMGWFIPLLATFLGAIFAFRLQESKEKGKLNGDRKAFINEALFILGARYNELLGIKMAMEPYSDEVQRALAMPSMVAMDLPSLRLSFKDLAFLAAVGKPDVLLDLAVEEQRFDSAIYTVKMRAEFHLNVLQPVMAEKKIGHGYWTREDLELAFGELVYGSAVNNAEQMRRHIYESVDSSLVMINNLHKVAKELYPRDVFIKVGPP